jgi:hypothetical protein
MAEVPVTSETALMPVSGGTGILRAWANCPKSPLLTANFGSEPAPARHLTPPASGVTGRRLDAGMARA